MSETILKSKKIEISNLLPPKLRDALVNASRIESPTMRAIKIDAVYSEARYQYPNLFKAE